MTLADDACLPAARPLATALCKQTPRCPYLTPSHPLNIKGLFIYLQPASILATALTYRYSPAPHRCSCSCNAPPPCIIHSRPLPLSPARSRSAILGPCPALTSVPDFPPSSSSAHQAALHHFASSSPSRGSLSPCSSRHLRLFRSDFDSGPLTWPKK